MNEPKELTDKEKIEILEERISQLFEFFKQFEEELNNYRTGGKFMECKGCGRFHFEKVRN